jgi:divalent metal cation (Fe/Co/Zn/Cd) transporter
MTFLDGCLSTGILTALILNAWLGWWWTDPAAAFLVAAFAVNEGVDHWRKSAPHEEGPEEPEP